MKKNVLYVITLLSCFVSMSSFSQHYQKTFSNAAYSDVKELASGEILLVGNKPNPEFGEDLAILQKLNTSGELIYSKSYDGEGYYNSFFGSYPNHSITLDATNVVLNFYASSFGENPSIYPSLMKLNDSGEVLWNKIYTNEDATGIPRGGISSTIIDNGNYVSVGWFHRGVGGFGDYFNMIQKTDSDGNVLWRKNFPPGFSYASDITTADNGDYVMIGGMSVGAFVYIFENNGEFVSAARYGVGTIYPTINQTLKTADGGYIIVGQIANNGFVMKLDEDYEVVWSKTYNQGNEEELFTKIIMTSDGGYFLVGSTKINSNANADGLLVKINDEGEVQWSKSYGRTSDDVFNGITKVTNGYYIVGSSGNNGWVLFSDENGNGNGCDEFTKEIIDEDIEITKVNYVPSDFHSTLGVIDEPIFIEDYTSNQVLPYDIEIVQQANDICSENGNLVQLTLTNSLATAFWSTSGNANFYTDANGGNFYDGTTKVNSVYIEAYQNQTIIADACGLSDTLEIDCFETVNNQFQKIFSNAVYTGIDVLPSGEFIAVGQPPVDQDGVASTEILFKKFSAEGNLLTSHSYSSPTEDGGLSLFNAEIANHSLLKDGNNYIVSIFGNQRENSIHPGLVKFSKDGEFQWNKIYQNETTLTGQPSRGGINKTIRDGNFYVSAGWMNGQNVTPVSQNSFSYYNLIQKTDLEGNVIWRYNFAPAFLWATDLVITPNGDYLVLAGHQAGTYIYLIGADGTYQWHKHIGSGATKAYQMLRTSDDGYIISGSSDENGYLMKIAPLSNQNNNITVEWLKKYNVGTNTTEFLKMIPDISEGFLLAGKYTDSSENATDGLLVKVNESGEVVFAKAYGREAEDVIFAIAQNGEGYLLAGKSGNNGLIISTNSLGEANLCDERNIELVATEFTPTVTDYSTLVLYSSTGAYDDNLIQSTYESNLIQLYNIEIEQESLVICATENNTLIEISLIDDLSKAIFTTNGNGTFFTDAEGIIVYDGTSRINIVYLQLNESQTITADSCGNLENLEITINSTDTPEAENSITIQEGLTLAELDVEGNNLTWYEDENLLSEIEDTLVAEIGKTYYVTQTIDNCESVAIAITIEAFLSTNDFDNQSFKSYPNPVKDVLNISYKDTIDSIAVYNLLGQQVLLKKPNTDSTQVNIQHLPNGNYLVKIQSENTIKTIKIIKN